MGLGGKIENTITEDRVSKGGYSVESVRMGVVLSPGEKPGDDDSFNQRTSHSRDRKHCGDHLSLWKWNRAHASMRIIITSSFPMSLGAWTPHSTFPAPIQLLNTKLRDPWHLTILTLPLLLQQILQLEAVRTECPSPSHHPHSRHPHTSQGPLPSPVLYMALYQPTLPTIATGS